MAEPYRLLVGDVRAKLAELPENSVHCVITSPPYYGLRAYGTDPQVWGGDGSECEHEWGPALPGQRSRWGDTDTLSEKQASNRGSAANVAAMESPGGQLCARCGAWKGELGLEPTVQMFVAHLVEVFQAVKRVLRNDGVCFVNIGDSYAGGDRSHRNKGFSDRVAAEYRGGGHKPHAANQGIGVLPVSPGIKAKNLNLIPERLMIALQEDDWWVRSKIIWWKRNAMPSSVEDRPSPCYEPVIMVTKSARYFYDRYACLQPYAASTLQEKDQGYDGQGQKNYAEAGVQNPSDVKRSVIESTKKHPGSNLRDVWDIPTQAFRPPKGMKMKTDHFATFPRALVERCILLATSAHGCCPHCGAPWKRIVEPSEEYAKNLGTNQGADRWRLEKGYKKMSPSVTAEYLTTGWQPTCKCEHTEDELEPCIVLDPFTGSGTTGEVALSMGRRFWGIELKEEYAAMARKRIGTQVNLLTFDLETSQACRQTALALSGG